MTRRPAHRVRHFTGTRYVSRSTVRRWRLDDVGPHYLKIGSIYRYPADDLEAWIAQSLTRN